MPKLKFGVIVFPGSNCDRDAEYAASEIMQQEARLIWHKEGSIGDVDIVIIPGGFSYGDYLRCGAVARFSPVMKDVVRFANNGGIVLGICNGFQVLTEAGLLPGVLLRNRSLRFICKQIHVKVEHTQSLFTSASTKGAVLRIPIAHGEGNFFAEPDVIKEIEQKNQVLFRYCDANGIVSEETNPNGSINSIAGIVNERGNVLGMMPHPERAMESVLGSEDGRIVFQSMINSVLHQVA